LRYFWCARAAGKLVAALLAGENVRWRDRKCSGGFAVANRRDEPGAFALKPVWAAERCPPASLRVLPLAIYGCAVLVNVGVPHTLTPRLTMLASPETAAFKKTRSEGEAFRLWKNPWMSCP